MAKAEIDRDCIKLTVFTACAPLLLLNKTRLENEAPGSESW